MGAGLLIVSAKTSEAQIGFGVTRVNGVVSGGQLQIGGFVTSGRTGVRLGVSTGASNLIGVQTFNVQNGGGNQAVAGNARRRQPNTGQFVRAAGQLDTNEDRRLDQEELAQVAIAVLAELKKQPGSRKRTRASRSGKAKKPKWLNEQMVATFVNRSMKFDRDDDDALNAAETKAMAAAFIRSLN